MTNRSVRSKLNCGLVMLSMCLQSACAARTQVAASQAATVDTSTPSASPTPVDTATPAETSTPVATSTPSGTATQLPPMTPPAEGKGNVVGLVLWNDRPVPHAAVWLCEGVMLGCTGTYQYKTNADHNGYFVFRNVTPGRYIVAINSFSSNWFMFYFASNGTREQSVSAGKDLVLDPWSIWKMDLNASYPSNAKVISNASPTFKWDPYPNAAYYMVSLYIDTSADAQSIVHIPQLKPLQVKVKVEGTEFTAEVPLSNCRYYWRVEAFNARGTKIAGSNQTSEGDLRYFVDNGLPTSCK